MSDDLTEISKRVASTVRTAGKIEFIRDQGPIRRNVRVQGFTWSPDRLRELSKILWACERAHSYTIASLRLFSRMPAADFSPDGLLGGVGYIQTIKDMRGALGQSVELLSTFCDTLHDEINASHWAQVSNDPDVQSIMEDTEETKANPEQFVQGEYDEDVNGDEGYLEVRNPAAEDYNPTVEADENADEEEDDWNSLYAPVAASTRVADGTVKAKGKHSELPEDETEQKQGVSAVEMMMNTTWENPPGGYASAIRKVTDQILERGPLVRQASTALPGGTVPTPRMDAIGPAEGGEFGFYNDPADLPSDDLSGEGFHSYDRILEGEDAVADGVSGKESPTKGDETFLKAAASVAGYSWLPGSKNEKLFNYYEPGLSEADIDWMKNNNAPDSPFTPKSSQKYMSDIDPLYERLI